MWIGCLCFVFFFKQKTAYEMRISDWSSDVCSSDLVLLSDTERLFNESAWLGLENQEYGQFRLGRQHSAAQQAGSGLEIAPWLEMGMGASYSFDTVGEQLAGQRYSLDDPRSAVGRVGKKLVSSFRLRGASGHEKKIQTCHNEKNLK